MLGSSRTAVCGQEPVSTPTIRSAASTPSSVARTWFASSWVKMSLVTTSGLRPAPRSRGTSASIRAVLPDPTGPPMPIRGMPGARCVTRCEWWLWECVWLMTAPSSTREQAQLGVLVPHRHEVGQRRVARDVVEIADNGPLGGLGEHAMDAPEHELGGQVVGQPQPYRGRDPTGGEGGQLACDGIERRYAEQSAEQAEHDRVVAGRVPELDEIDVPLHRHSGDCGGRGEERPTRSGRRFPTLAGELHGVQASIDLYDPLGVHASVRINSAVGAGESDAVRGGDAEADAVPEKRSERAGRARCLEQPGMRDRLEPLRERAAPTREARVGQLQHREEHLAMHQTT